MTDQIAGLVKGLRGSADMLNMEFGNEDEPHIAKAVVRMREAASALEALAASSKRAEEERERCIAELTKPILWDEMREFFGKSGDAIDFSGIEVQNAACAVLRKRAAAAIRSRTSPKETDNG